MSTTVCTNDQHVHVTGSTAERPRVLRQLFRGYRWRLLLTYGLFNLENMLRLAQPLVLGLAINDLIRSSYRGLLLLVAQHVAFVTIASLRQLYDTRTFTATLPAASYSISDETTWTSHALRLGRRCPAISSIFSSVTYHLSCGRCTQ